jgi:glycolate oxidase iron-sulfur subunit
MAGENARALAPQASAFDERHPPSRPIIDTCVHCGFCLPVCPTYVLWNEEMDSPRGRIYLMKLAADGQATINPQWVSHFDTCLGCMACTTACPSGVDYGKLIEATRAQIERKHDRGFREKLFRKFIFGLFTRPDRLRMLRWPLLFYQRSGVQALVRRTGMLGILPERLQAMDALLPPLSDAEPPAEITPAQGQKRVRLGLLLGCVQREFFPDVNAATARVLSAEGCEVVAPEFQPCCGALMLHAGEEEAALQLARRTIEAFERAQVDFVVTNAAGCGSNLREYGHLLRDDPKYAERARRFAEKCADISEMLAVLPPLAERHPLPVRVAYHDACHLQHAQGIRQQPRAVLSQIPELQILEIDEPAVCCGSAGIYNLVQPSAANALGDRKAQHIMPLNADVVVTGNPGCILQLRASLARAGSTVPVLHTVQLLDASLRGQPVESLYKSA